MSVKLTKNLKVPKSTAATQHRHFRVLLTIRSYQVCDEYGFSSDLIRPVISTQIL